MIRLAVVHEVSFIGDMLAAVLSRESDIQIIGCAKNAEEALSWLTRRACDVCLVNLTLPDNGVWRLLKTASEGAIQPKLLVTGLVRSRTAIVQCLEAGAAGYFLADEPLADLVNQVRAVHANELLIAPEIAAALLTRIAELKDALAELPSRRALTLLPGLTPLSLREREVLELIAQGRSNQEIAQVLRIEVGTVKNHVHRIFKKFDVPNRKEAVAFAHQLQGQTTVKAS